MVVQTRTTRPADQVPRTLFSSAPESESDDENDMPQPSSPAPAIQSAVAKAKATPTTPRAKPAKTPRAKGVAPDSAARAKAEALRQSFGEYVPYDVPEHEQLLYMQMAHQQSCDAKADYLIRQRVSKCMVQWLDVATRRKAALAARPSKLKRRLLSAGDSALGNLSRVVTRDSSRDSRALRGPRERTLCEKLCLIVVNPLFTLKPQERSGEPRESCEYVWFYLLRRDMKSCPLGHVTT